MEDTSKVILLVVLLVAVVVLGPLLLIWALNTLFPILAIQYTIETWTAALIISACLRTTVSKK